ncbi:MAG TPA: hypothetical protein VGG28_25000 [Kofleriaceae bacterium]
MTKAEIGQVVKLLLASYATQRARLTAADVEGMFEAYAAALGDLDVEAVRAAVIRIVRTSKWLPTVADIRSEVGELAHAASRAGLEAWGDIVRAMQRYGSHRTPGIDFTFDDPVIAELVSSTLWRELCGSDNAVADRARFVDAYNQKSQHERKEIAASVGATRELKQLAGGIANALAAPTAPSTTTRTPDEQAEIHRMLADAIKAMR